MTWIEAGTEGQIFDLRNPAVKDVALLSPNDTILPAEYNGTRYLEHR